MTNGRDKHIKIVRCIVIQTVSTFSLFDIFTIAAAHTGTEKFFTSTKEYM